MQVVLQEGSVERPSNMLLRACCLLFSAYSATHTVPVAPTQDRACAPICESFITQMHVTPFKMTDNTSMFGVGKQMHYVTQQTIFLAGF